MFGRKKQKLVKVTPQIPSKMLLENGAANLLEQIRRDHEENVEMCSRLIAIRNWMDKAKADKLKDAMEWADQFDFWSNKINETLARMQGETETEPLQLTSAVSNGAVQSEAQADEPRAIGFRAEHRP